MNTNMLVTIDGFLLFVWVKRTAIPRAVVVWNRTFIFIKAFNSAFGKV